MRSFPGKRVGATMQPNLGNNLSRSGFGLVVLLLVAGLLWNGPVLLAQDDIHNKISVHGDLVLRHRLR